ncbi:hypothetical protein M758_2G142400 [Ceratodon purpureus]|nr:hypothetical protein M758_2G142400 [Ceratodon purpureus]
MRCSIHKPQLGKTKRKTNIAAIDLKEKLDTLDIIASIPSRTNDYHIQKKRGKKIYVIKTSNTGLSK